MVEKSEKTQKSEKFQVTNELKLNFVNNFLTNSKKFFFFFDLMMMLLQFIDKNKLNIKILKNLYFIKNIINLLILFIFFLKIVLPLSTYMNIFQTSKSNIFLAWYILISKFVLYFPELILSYLSNFN